MSKDDFENKLIKFISSNMLPLSIVDSVEFRDLFSGNYNYII